MMQSNSDEDGEVLRLAQSLDLPYPVCVSQELSQQIKPNEFLTKLGIQYTDRIQTILGILKGNMVPKQAGSGGMPKQGIVFPLALAKGPFIKEELISIKAEVKDDGGETVILLTAVPEEE
jgi:hypothetical protein